MHDAENPLKASAIIGDEQSMTDQSLMHSLLSARPAGCPILLVGDPWQLPPVSAGAPFRDITKFVPTGILTEVHRNAGTIARTAKAIRDGKDFHCDDVLDLDFKGPDLQPSPKNHIHLETDSPEKQLDSLESLLTRLEGMTDDPLWDIQVLGIVNKNSPLSINEINKRLHHRYNKDAPVVDKCPFRVGDKVMNWTNSWMSPATQFCRKNQLRIMSDGVKKNPKGELYVANGEFGTVLDIQPAYMVVEIRDPVRVVMAFRKGIEEGSEEGQTGSNFQHAYCITTHKSQGSQFKFVVAMIDEYIGAKRLADRSLWYTMLTRTKHACFSIGRKSTIVSASARSAIDDRKTFLVERLKGDL